RRLSLRRVEPDRRELAPREVRGIVRVATRTATEVEGRVCKGRLPGSFVKAGVDRHEEDARHECPWEVAVHRSHLVRELVQPPGEVLVEVPALVVPEVQTLQRRSQLQ